MSTLSGSVDDSAQRHVPFVDAFVGMFVHTFMSILMMSTFVGENLWVQFRFRLLCVSVIQTAFRAFVLKKGGSTGRALFRQLSEFLEADVHQSCRDQAP